MTRATDVLLVDVQLYNYNMYSCTRFKSNLAEVLQEEKLLFCQSFLG